MTESTGASDRTSRLLRANAETLEEAEAVLHRSAEAAWHPENARRLHRLGDAVTAEAHRIEDRADLLDEASAQRRGESVVSQPDEG